MDSIDASTRNSPEAQVIVPRKMPLCDRHPLTLLIITPDNTFKEGRVQQLTFTVLCMHTDCNIN